MAIEPAWGLAKNHIAKENYVNGVTFDNLQYLINAGLATVTPAVAAKLLEKVKRREDFYWAVIEQEMEKRKRARENFPDFMFRSAIVVTCLFSVVKMYIHLVAIHVKY